ncbi:hypothetical protein BDV36DRAFT_302150 [Aspergillus pseudocaelatus]|uniref:ABC transmembrane type-1 domain-containing protein n=1 Tax=Aspergillus pseudocaelatus TaxID=1825620 RepID=A0ABQ6W1R7_9EURO|nr:hypothetical protein BDV36DRAFT_302150 [Aspergillus pseudocaelatus]
MEHARLIPTGTGFLLVLVLNVYVFQHILSWATRWITTPYQQPLGHVYEDQDGKSTQQAIEQAGKQTLRLANLVIATVTMAILGLRMGLAIPHMEFSANAAYWMDSMIPRRPNVFHKGIIVDRQLTTSLLGWVSFSWIEPVLRESEHSKSLAIDDLLELDNSTREETAYRVWKRMAAKRSLLSSWDLWRSIFQSHGRALLSQTMITILVSFLSFGPQIALWQILKLLEARMSGQNSICFGSQFLASVSLECNNSYLSLSSTRQSAYIESRALTRQTTDDLIQRSLRSALGQYQTTFLAFAHRLKTIADSDMVLVMDNGMIVESGSPKELLYRDQSCFRSMVCQDPEREILENIILNGNGVE